MRISFSLLRMEFTGDILLAVRTLFYCGRLSYLDKLAGVLILTSHYSKTSYVTEGPFPEIKQPECEANSSPSSSSNIKYP